MNGHVMPFLPRSEPKSGFVPEALGLAGLQAQASYGSFQVLPAGHGQGTSRAA